MSDASKDRVLKKIREALTKKTASRFPDVDFARPVFETSALNHADQFEESLVKAQGCVYRFPALPDALLWLKNFLSSRDPKTVFCLEKHLGEKLKKYNISFCSDDFSDPDLMDTSITSCEILSARTGSIFISSAMRGGKILGAYAATHIIIAFENQLVPDIKDALIYLQKKYEVSFPSHIICISGPSRTADIEKTLVLGAHGPRELIVLLMKESSV